MYAAVIAVAVVIGAIVGGFVWFGMALRDAERRTADARVSDQGKSGEIAIAHATVRTERERGDAEQRRADALDEELDHVAEDGDVAGARERVLSRYKRQAAAGAVPAPGDDPDGVHADTPPAAVGAVDREGLERPGD